MVTFTGCRVDDLPAVLRFFASMYSPDYVLARNEEFFRWQYGGAGTVNGSLNLRLSLVDREIAGCVGYVPVEAQVGGRIVSAAWAANLIVDEKYRRLGLGPLLIRELAKHFDVSLTLGGNRAAHDMLPRMGWTDFGDLQRYVSVVNPEGAAALIKAGSLEWPNGLRSPAFERARTDQIVQVARFSDAATALWEELYGDVAGTRRSATYLNWRYSRHPVFAYRLFESRDGGRLAGFAVYRVEEVRDLPVRVGRIVELVADDERAIALVRRMVEDGIAHGVSVFDFFCSSPRVAPVMAKAGFLRGDQEPASAIPQLFQPIDRGRTGVLFMADLRKVSSALATEWYVTTADDDQDRPS